MSYTDPKEVKSPKSHWRLLEVLHNTKEGGWSLAKGQWEIKGQWRETLAIRWNGSPEASGNPQSHGNPTWFILPDDLHEVVRTTIKKPMRS